MDAEHYSKLTQGWHNLLRLNSNTVYVPIPKNAHTWMLRSFECTQETHADINDRFLVILRDPIDRWITGIGTYCGNHNFFKREFHSNQAPNWPLFFRDTLMPDGHTVPQTYFLRNVPLDQADIFIVNRDLKQHISSYLNVTTELSNANVTANSGYHRRITASLKQYLSANPSVTEQLKNMYAEDYAVLKTASPNELL